MTLETFWIWIEAPMTVASLPTPTSVVLDGT